MPNTAFTLSRPNSFTTDALGAMAMGREFATLRLRGPRACRWAAALAMCAGALAMPAAAQDNSTAQAVTSVVEPLSLSKQSDLDFGQIAVNGAGTVVMTVGASPTCTVTGGLIKYGACDNAVFEGYGQPGRNVRLKIPRNTGIIITGPGGATMRISNIVTSGGTTLGPPSTGSANGNGFRRHRIISSDGSFEFRLAGTLNVAAGQAGGLYTGTFDVEIAYE